ncbi:stress-response protein [Salmonella enterica subsp. enterica]|nr:stress-response protein [Salmonella enterica subsp. enterica]
MMNKDEAGGNWKQFKGKMKEQWGKLTDDDMTVIEGKRDQLVGKIQERYGYQKDQAEKEVVDWETRKQLSLVICFPLPGVHGCASPCLLMNAGVPPLYCRPFSVQANVVFSSPAPSDRDHSFPDGDTLLLLRTQGTDRAPQ